MYELIHSTISVDFPFHVGLVAKDASLLTTSFWIPAMDPAMMT